MYDEIIRVPLVLRVPKSLLEARSNIRTNLALNANTRNVGNIDILPTLLDLMGLSQAQKGQVFAAEMAGLSLLNETPVDRLLYIANSSENKPWDQYAYCIVSGDERFMNGQMLGRGVSSVAVDRLQRTGLFPPSPEFLQRIEAFSRGKTYLEKMNAKLE